MIAKSKIAAVIGGVFTTLVLMVQPVVANDQPYAGDNEYFASKYHHRHPHHWNNDRQMGDDTPTHWGRDRRRGIHLDGHDGDA